MVEGLEVVIKYRGAKYDQVASPATASSEFAILKKDLAHLRVHSPSQKNVRRVNGSFILHWPTAGTSPKVEILADSLHVRWFKLCSNDPEAVKLREFLSIECITLTQDGVLLRSTAGAEQGSQDVPPAPLADRLSDPLLEIAQQSASVKPQALAPVLAPAPAPAPASPILPPPPPPRIPPSAPRLDRQLPHLKRRLSTLEGPSSPTRQKLDAPGVQTSAPLRSASTQLQQAQPPTSPRGDQQPGPSIPGDTTKGSPQPTQDHTTTPLAVQAHPSPPSIPPEPQTALQPELPPPEPGEMPPHASLPSVAPVSTSVSAPSPLGLGSGPRMAAASPYLGSPSSGNGDPHVTRLRDRDVNRLMRELWDTRRQLTAVQAREKVILDDLERLDARPKSAGADRNSVSREELSRLEAELKAENARRLRAERALSDVERECRAPFVVPALLQAFMSISELSNSG